MMDSRKFYIFITLLMASYSLSGEVITSGGYAPVTNTGGVWQNDITVIDISLHTAITIDCDWGEIGNLENSDRFRFQYKIDPPGPWITVASQNNDICAGVCGGSGPSISLFGLEGDQLRIRIRSRNGPGETWWTDNLLVTGTPIPLPVELLYFEAKVDNTIIIFTWATGSEINNDYFYIEESKDAIDYTSIEFMVGAGDSDSRIDYSVTTPNNQDGGYYRLKQVDFDGTVSYSSIINVKPNVSSRFIIGIFDINGVPVDFTYKGIIIIMYDDYSFKKIIRK